MVLPTGTICPSADAIATELDRLGATAALAALGSPEVTVKDTKMHVVLRGQDGSMLGARDVAAPEACNERATVAAVFIAAWVGEWTTAPMADSQNSTLAASNRKPLSSSVPRPPPRTLDSTSRTSLPLREQVELAKADDSKPPDAKATASSTKESAPETTPIVPASRKLKPETRGEVAALGFGTHDGDAGTFGAGVSVGYRPAGALALAALFEGTGERERTLSPGLAAYRTFRLGVGAGMLRRWGQVFGDVGIFPELTLLTLSGKQLQSGRAATAWGAAADLRARFGFTWGRFAPFLLAGASYALRGERLTLDDRSQSITLSRWNVSAGAGLAFLFGEK
jgi:hypothetical protein